MNGRSVQSTRLPFRLALTIMVSCASLMLAGSPSARPSVAQAASLADVPVALVASDVVSYTLAAPKLFWRNGVPSCPPAAALTTEPQAAQPAQQASTFEIISRIATYGSAVRQLYSQAQNCNQGQIRSNIVADASFLYWLGPNGLMKLSTSANPGDVPQLLSGAVKSYGELAISDDSIFALTGDSSIKSVRTIKKSDGADSPLIITAGSAGRMSFDGEFLYYIVGGDLQRIDVTVPNASTTLTSGVSSYYAEGRRVTFNGQILFITKNVYIAKGSQVFIYRNTSNTLGTTPVYSSADASASIHSLTSDFSKLFLSESRPVGCSPSPCFQSYTPVLVRSGRGGGTADVLYTGTPSIFFNSFLNLTTDGTYLFWQENSTIQRIANDASALPQINMRITGIEVTQGIQNLSNSVLLVKGKRTFVRLYVKSDGPAVAGVTAQLSSNSLEAGPLLPVNSVGTAITVRSNPNRNDLNQSFLFELPWSWTKSGSVSLQAVLNPYKVPLQTNYSNNNASIAVSFLASPKLSAEFYRLNYTVGGTTYRPRIDKDILQTYSWIMRAYPIGGSIGQNFKPRLWDVNGGTKLGNWVTQSSNDCNGQGNLCASYYTNGWLKYYRDHGWVPNTNDFYYGMISDGAAFPRGQALYSKTSVGPSGSGDWGWDTDGSYADWYAGHEIGHSLGRAHPTPSAASCGNSASDPSYPYPGAQIGPNDGSMEGFDPGDPAFGIPRAIYPGTSWYDVLSYCSNQWISDYTYTGMYNFMIANPSLAETGTARLAAVGDFLSLSGVISPTASSASFAALYRLSSVMSQPPLTAGGYSIRLLNGTTTLADYPFTPTESDDGVGLSFDQVIDFVADTNVVQIIRTSDGAVLASRAVSANPPTISGVALQGAVEPVTGIVTLGWVASDPDGDPLTFDIFYSRDSGATFQPAQMGVSGSSAQIDTAMLGGSGTAIFRVAANDGVNTAEADSAPFTMAGKPPEPYVLSPADPTTIHYGQLVNFSSVALDAQDGIVDDAGLVWTLADGTVLGSGALVSSDTLPVGSNVITLTATNSVGESASTTVTVIVDDNLNLPGPALSTGPGQVGWHIVAGTTEVQTATISINNAGSDALNWTASSNQPWLTLSEPSGTVADGGDPSSLTISANPAGLASNAIYTGTLTITRPAVNAGEPVQTVLIPVSLSIGDTWNLPGQAIVQRKLYLPMLSR